MKKFLALFLAAAFLVGVAGCGAEPKVVERVVEKPVDRIVEKLVEKPVDKDAIVREAVEKSIAAIPADFAQLPPEKLKERVDAGAPLFLLDVRKADEVAKDGKLAGSVNIPLHDLGKSLDKLPQDKAAPIVAYCAVGARGTMAMMSLRNLGYTNVLNLKGGLAEWTKANLPVVR